MDRLSALDRAFEDRPVPPEDPRYFPFHEAKGDPRGMDPVSLLSVKIRLRKGGETAQLFSGYRGTGKSTELLRLASNLRSEGYRVLFVPAGRFVNLNEPLEITDLLLSIAAGVVEQSGPDVRESLKTGLLKRVSTFLTRTQVHLKSVVVGPDWGRFTADLSRDPTFKLSVQEALRGRLTDLVSDFQAFLKEVATLAALREGGRSPVLIVDDLEKVRGSGPNQDLVQRSMEQVFSEFHWALKVPDWHVVWAAPPYLELMNSAIPGQFDAWVFLPMIRLWKDGIERPIDADGLEAMRQFVGRRGDAGQVLASADLLDRILLASSGHVRDVLKLMGQVVVSMTQEVDRTGRLAVADETAVKRILADHALFIRNSVHSNDHAWLGQVATKHDLVVPDESMIQRAAKLIDTAVVMMYRNDHRWFDVHWALRDVVGQEPDEPRRV
jgi:hypothetical protein